MLTIFFALILFIAGCSILSGALSAFLRVFKTPPSTGAAISGKALTLSLVTAVIVIMLGASAM